MSMKKVETVRCPACSSKTGVIVQQIVDASDLVVKSALLQARTHSASCANCGATVVRAVPTLYYDLDKALALVFAPADLHLATPTQEATIASLTTALAASLPPELRGADYLAAPRRCASLEALVEAVLEADGISKEMLAAQTARAQLIETLLRSTDEAELRAKAASHAAELDDAFFELLTAYMQAAQLEGDQASAQTFLALRTLAAQLTPGGKQIIADIDARLGLRVIQSRDELLEQLRAAPDEQARAALVETGQVLLDPTFFQQLDARIAQAALHGDSAQARSLHELRDSIVALKAAQDARTQQAMRRAASLFSAVVQSEAPDKVLKRRLGEVDDAFFVVLGANIERARRQGQSEPVRALELIGKLARTMLQEKVAI
jgi:hypothetical protein